MHLKRTAPAEGLVFALSTTTASTTGQCLGAGADALPVPTLTLSRLGCRKCGGRHEYSYDCDPFHHFGAFLHVPTNPDMLGMSLYPVYYRTPESNTTTKGK